MSCCADAPPWLLPLRVSERALQPSPELSVASSPSFAGRECLLRRTRSMPNSCVLIASANELVEPSKEVPSQSSTSLTDESFCRRLSLASSVHGLIQIAKKCVVPMRVRLDGELTGARVRLDSRWVWVPEEHEGYVGGWVSKDLGDDVKAVVLSESGQVRARPPLSRAVASRRGVVALDPPSATRAHSFCLVSGSRS